jgi:hypothetical protein
VSTFGCGGGRTLPLLRECGGEADSRISQRFNANASTQCLYAPNLQYAILIVIAINVTRRMCQHTRLKP